MTLAVAESKRIQDLVRYAEKFQEKQGYFEQGMQLVYHFGGMDEPSPTEKPESNEAKRRKREHDKNSTEVSRKQNILKFHIFTIQSRHCTY